MFDYTAKREFTFVVKNRLNYLGLTQLDVESTTYGKS